MRNAVIRKKRIAVERAIENFLRTPTRIMVPDINVHCDVSPENIKSWHRESIDFRFDGPFVWTV